MRNVERKRSIAFWSSSLVLCSLMLSTPVRADSPEWQSLSAENQDMLSDFHDRWASLPVPKRERLIERAERWRSLPNDQRQAIRQRWLEIKQLPPEARAALRQRWESMSAEERQQVVSEHPSHMDTHEAGQYRARTESSGSRP